MAQLHNHEKSATSAPSADKKEASAITQSGVAKDTQGTSTKLSDSIPHNSGEATISEDNVMVDVCSTGKDLHRQSSLLPSMSSVVTNDHSSVVLLERYPFLSSARRAEADVDYDNLIAQQRWLPHQGALFLRTLKVLEASYLARIAHQDTDKLSGHMPHEVTLVSLHTSRSAEKLRGIFAEISWDKQLMPWLNAMLLDFLDRTLLEEYIDILRHLRLKCAELMEARGLLDGRGSRRLGGNSVLRQALATPPTYTDPGYPPAKTWAFPVEPIIVLGPGEHSWASSSHLVGWKTRLEALGTVVTCPEAAETARDTAVMAKNLLRTVKEVKQQHRGKPVVLFGVSVGAKVAIMVSFKERVDCLVCLGLQMQEIAGNASDAVDTRDLFQLRPPTLFAIGSQSRLCPVPLMEKVRLQMIARNKLVIVRDGDEMLRIPLSNRLKVTLTQPLSNALVIEQIGSFIHDTLTRRAEQDGQTPKQRRVDPGSMPARQRKRQGSGSGPRSKATGATTGTATGTTTGTATGATSGTTTGTVSGATTDIATGTAATGTATGASSATSSADGSGGTKVKGAKTASATPSGGGSTKSVKKRKTEGAPAPNKAP